MIDESHKLLGQSIGLGVLLTIAACSSDRNGHQGTGETKDTAHELVDAGEASASHTRATDAGSHDSTSGDPLTTATAGSGSIAADGGDSGSDASQRDAAGAKAAVANGGDGGAGGAGGFTAPSSAGGHGGGGSLIASAGSGGVATNATGGTGGAAGAEAATTAEPPCLQKPSELVLLGDSYANLPTSHSFPSDLDTAFGAPVRNASQTDAWLAAGMGAAIRGTSIPEEYAATIAQDPDVLAVIMTGGADDIFISDVLNNPDGYACRNDADPTKVKACQDIINNATASAKMLFAAMAKDGIADVVYFSYPHVASGSDTSLPGTNPNGMLQYLASSIKPVCDATESMTGGKLRCHFLDLVPVFDGHPDWFDTMSSIAGLYPNSTGSKAIAQAVVKLLKDECIAQPASSGCCVP